MSPTGTDSYDHDRPHRARRPSPPAEVTYPVGSVASSGRPDDARGRAATAAAPRAAQALVRTLQGCRWTWTVRWTADHDGVARVEVVAHGRAGDVLKAGWNTRLAGTPRLLGPALVAGNGWGPCHLSLRAAQAFVLAHPRPEPGPRAASPSTTEETR